MFNKENTAFVYAFEDFKFIRFTELKQARQELYHSRFEFYSLKFLF